MQGYKAISSHLAGWTGSVGGFVRDLNRRGTRYLAYSQVSSLEFCPYRYFLEFVKRVRLRPQPDYFVKGHLFHSVASKYYTGLARNRPVSVQALHSVIDRRGREDGHHLKNAITLAVQHAHTGWEVVGVEQPFVLSLGKALPPCVVVIDLLLRQGKQYAVVDHKTGKNFNEPDDLQIEVYREYVRRRYRSKSCSAFFDEYRWVNNLDRVRKAAFKRTEIIDNPKAWSDAENRLSRSFKAMRMIERDRDAPGTGPCYMCPFSGRCEKSSTSSYGR
jgi:hypothetical protein